MPSSGQWPFQFKSSSRVCLHVQLSFQSPSNSASGSLWEWIIVAESLPWAHINCTGPFSDPHSTILGVLLGFLSKNHHSRPIGCLLSLIKGGGMETHGTLRWLNTSPQPRVCNSTLSAHGLGAGARGYRCGRAREWGSIYAALRKPSCLWGADLPVQLLQGHVCSCLYLITRCSVTRPDEFIDPLR